MKQTLGHPYDLNFGKLMKKEPGIDEIAEEGEFRENKGFFCSELLAYLYKRLKLLETDKPASKFWKLQIYIWKY